MISASPAFRQWLERYESSGDLGCVRLGVTREEVRAWFGEPDDTAKGFRRQPLMGIWRYGVVEFHFSSEGELWLVYAEQPDPDLAPRIILSSPTAQT